eukprot:1852570-Rhodomonas_salina.1
MVLSDHIFYGTMVLLCELRYSPTPCPTLLGADRASGQRRQRAQTLLRRGTARSGAAHQLLQDKADITKNVIADIKQWIGTRVQRT